MVVLTAVPGSRRATLAVSLKSRVAELTALGSALKVRRKLPSVSLPKMLVMIHRNTLPTPRVPVDRDDLCESMIKLILNIFIIEGFLIFILCYNQESLTLTLRQIKE